MMDVETLSTIFALLGFAAVAAATTAALMGRRSAELRQDLAAIAIPFAFAVALVATLGSLYYSGIVHFRPCRLCWWQRISMYPLVPLLGLGLVRRDRSVAVYGLPLSLMGLAWSAYHSWIRWFPGDGTSCELDAACTTVWINTFGFVSIPFMAGCGFLAISIALLVHLRWTADAPIPHQSHAAQPTTQEKGLSV